MIHKLNNILSSFFTRFKTPKFWAEDGIIPQLLIPLTLVYFISKHLFAKKAKPLEVSCKVISIGNPIVGGAGKTPSVLAVWNILSDQYKDKKICFLSKGYGGSNISPKYVDISKDKSSEVGDEPLILARRGVTIVAKDRLQGLLFAESEGFDIVIIDDGLHDNRFNKVLNIAVIDGSYGLGNRLVLPSGPLRDRVDIALDNVDKILLIGDDKTSIMDHIKERVKGREFEVIAADIEQSSKHDDSLIYVAFAGIANPSKFFDSLREKLNLVVEEQVSFPDHYKYSEEDFEYLESLALECNAQLITTEKDFVKIPDGIFSPEEIEVVNIDLKFRDPNRVKKIFDLSS